MVREIKEDSRWNSRKTTKNIARDKLDTSHQAPGEWAGPTMQSKDVSTMRVEGNVTNWKRSSSPGSR